MNKKELLKSEFIFNCNETFDYIYIIPTMRKHDSGYRKMEIIGCIVKGNEDGSNKYIKLSSYSDVVDIGSYLDKINGISIDVEPENNCIRLFSRNGKLKPIFQVSSCTFKIIN